MKKRQFQQEKQKILAKAEISVATEKFYVSTGSQENQQKLCRNCLTNFHIYQFN